MAPKHKFSTRTESLLLRQEGYTEHLRCCLPHCDEVVQIFDPDLDLPFCGEHESFTPTQVEEYCANCMSSSSDSDNSSSSDNESEHQYNLVNSNSTVTALINNNESGNTNNNTVNTVNIMNYFRRPSVDTLPTPHRLASKRKTLKTNYGKRKKGCNSKHDVKNPKKIFERIESYPNDYLIELKGKLLCTCCPSAGGNPTPVCTKASSVKQHVEAQTHIFF